MEAITLQAKKRELTGRKTNILRADGEIPAVVYGEGMTPVNIKIARNEMEKLYSKVGESTLVSLDIEGKQLNVLIQDIQKNPVTDFFTHVDFRQINMNKKVETAIRLVLEGEAPAVKELGGVLIQSLEEVEIEALPTDLVYEIFVSIASLKTFDDVLRVSDIEFPKGIQVLTEGRDAIASVHAPRTAEEIEALEETIEVDVDSVEVTSKKEGEEGGKNEKAE